MPRHIKVLRNGHPCIVSNVSDTDILLTDEEYDNIVAQKQSEHEELQKKIDKEAEESRTTEKLIQDKIREIAIGIIVSENLSRIT